MAKQKLSYTYPQRKECTRLVRARAAGRNELSDRLILTRSRLDPEPGLKAYLDAWNERESKPRDDLTA